MQRNENNIMYRSKKLTNWSLHIYGEYRYEILLRGYLREPTGIIFGNNTVILWCHN